MPTARQNGKLGFTEKGMHVTAGFEGCIRTLTTMNHGSRSFLLVCRRRSAGVPGRRPERAAFQLGRVHARGAKSLDTFFELETDALVSLNQWIAPAEPAEARKVGVRRADLGAMLNG